MPSFEDEAQLLKDAVTTMKNTYVTLYI